MNRVIKFRGKSVETDEWVYGFYSECVESGDNGGVEHMYREYKTRLHMINTDDGYAHVIPETVGQYTGLKDKNGAEIYEGDRVMSGHNKSDEWIESSGTVKWDADYGMFVQVLDSPNEGCEQMMDVVCTVIGNIHEHPGFLEAK